MSLMLQGCNSGMVRQAKRIDLPPELTKKCEDAYKAENGKFSTLFRNHVELRGQYDECMTRHNALVDRIKDINSE